MTSQTLNFKLNLPEFDLRTWHKLVNQNFEVVDAVLQQYLSVQNLQGVWLNSTHYLVGQAVVDEVQGIIYTCKVEHTSAAVPTLFAADRAANSSYWGGIATPEHFRGVWAANTTYAVRDFVVSGAIYAVCITAHTSNIAGVFGNDAAFWTYLVNLSGFNLPSITGHGTHFLRARADETGLEYRTPAQVAADIGAGTGTVTTVNTGVGLIGGGFTTAGIISLADTAVVPGTYAMPGSIQIDQQGRIIAASAAGFAAAAVALVTAAANFAGDLTTTSTDAAAGAGPLLSMDRNSASPAVADILGQLRWLGRSSTAVQREYASILANILDPVNATEDAQMDFRTMVAGTAAARMSLAQGIFTPLATGGDKGVDTFNAKHFYKDGVEIGSGGPGSTLLFLTPLSAEPPATNFGQIAFRNGHPTLQFDTTTQWNTIWTAVMPQGYTNATGVTVIIQCSAATAVAGTIGWLISFERMATTLDIDADGFAADQTMAAVTVSGTSGQPKIMTLAITKGANMNSIVAGDTFRIRIKRDVASDTAAGNAEIISVEIRET